MCLFLVHPRAWKKELKRQAEGKNPSLVRAFARAYGLFYLFMGGLATLQVGFSGDDMHALSQISTANNGWPGMHTKQIIAVCASIYVAVLI